MSDYTNTAIDELKDELAQSCDQVTGLSVRLGKEMDECAQLRARVEGLTKYRDRLVNDAWEWCKLLDTEPASLGPVIENLKAEAASLRRERNTARSIAWKLVRNMPVHDCSDSDICFACSAVATARRYLPSTTEAPDLHSSTGLPQRLANGKPPSGFGGVPELNRMTETLLDASRHVTGTTEAEGSDKGLRERIAENESSDEPPHDKDLKTVIGGMHRVAMEMKAEREGSEEESHGPSSASLPEDVEDMLADELWMGAQGWVPCVNGNGEPGFSLRGYLEFFPARLVRVARGMGDSVTWEDVGDDEPEWRWVLKDCEDTESFTTPEFIQLCEERAKEGGE